MPAPGHAGGGPGNAPPATDLPRPAPPRDKDTIAAAPGAERHIDLFCRAFAIKLYELQIAHRGGSARVLLELLDHRL